MSHLCYRRCILLLVASLVLSACSIPAVSPPAAAPESAATPEAAAELSPTPVALDETIQVAEGGFSLDYPAEWETRVVSSTLEMAANSAALNALTPGEQIVILVDSIPLAMLAEQHGSSQVDDLEGLFDVSSSEFERAGYTIGATSPITVDGQAGLSANLGGGGGAGQLIVVQTPVRRVRIVGQASPAAWQDQQAIFAEIVGSVSLFVPVNPPTPTLPNQATQPERITEGPPGFVLRLGSNQGSLSGRFVSARGLTTAPDGTLYVAESSRGVWAFAPDGKLVGTFGEGELNDSYDVALGRDGVLFVADYGSNSIVRFDAKSGKVEQRWGEVGDQPEQFGLLSPQRIAVGADGSVYALDSRVEAGGSVASVVRFNGADGSFIERVALPPGSAPNDLVVDRSGNIYLAETVNGGVVKVDPQGQILARFGENVAPAGITVGAIDLDVRGNIYIATWNNGLIKLAPDGTVLTQAGTIAEPGTIPQPGQFTLPNGIAAGPGEVVWVSDNNGEYSAITAMRLTDNIAGQSNAQPQATVQVTPPPESALVRQWASRATASSFYDDSYAPDGATGPPDVGGCLSSPAAWASSAPDSQETLELGFDQPLYATQLNIYQTHQPGSIVRIDLTDIRGSSTTVYTNTAALIDTCPFVQTVDFGPTLSPVVSVTLSLDQSNGTSWNEIDAVEIVGLP